MTLRLLTNFAALCLATGLLSLSLSGCAKEKNELAHSHDHDHDHDHTPAHNHEDVSPHDDDETPGEIVLEHSRAAKLGVSAKEIVPGDFFETLTVGGELSPAPSAQSTVSARSAGIVTLSKHAIPGTHLNAGQPIATISGKGVSGGDANESAQVALQAAKRELDRLTPLHADGIVSTRDYNAALQIYEAAKAAAGTGSYSGSTATAVTSGTLMQLLVNEGQYVEAGTPLAVISAGATLTLKANLPERNVDFLKSIGGARFRTSYSPEIHDITEFNGKRAYDAAATVATRGYIPVYFTLTNDGTLAAGSYCEVYLTGNRRQGVISVPKESLSEQQGQYFVYVQLDDDCYEKRPVKTGASTGTEIEILSGIASGDKVVTAGTTFVRLAESSGAVPEGHSHNH